MLNAPRVPLSHPVELSNLDPMPGLFTKLALKLQTLLGDTKPKRDTLGDRGENAAARFLRGKGFTIITRNYRVDSGEVDIIARDGKTLVFVEVKTRQSDEPRPESQVNSEKMHQITKAAKVYISRYGYPRPPARFDVVAVIWPEGNAPVIRHTEHAFEATF